MEPGIADLFRIHIPLQRDAQCQVGIDVGSQCGTNADAHALQYMVIKRMIPMRATVIIKREGCGALVDNRYMILHAQIEPAISRKEISSRNYLLSSLLLLSLQMLLSLPLLSMHMLSPFSYKIKI